MKRFTSILLAVLMVCSCVLCLASCGGDADTSGTGKTELHMATNAFFEPWEYYDGDDIVGIDAEVAEAICDKLGYELVIDDMDFDSIVTAVSTGKADFGMAGMTVTEERKQSVDFTDSYATSTQVIIVSPDSSVAKVDDLPGKKIGVQLGTTGDSFASDYEEEGSTIERYNKGADAILALTSGKIDCVIIDSEPAKAFVKENEGLKILDEPFADEEYAICVAKDSELTEKINTALSELKKDGTIDKIMDKYIGD